MKASCKTYRTHHASCQASSRAIREHLVQQNAVISSTGQSDKQNLQSANNQQTIRNARRRMPESHSAITKPEAEPEAKAEKKPARRTTRKSTKPAAKDASSETHMMLACRTLSATDSTAARSRYVQLIEIARRRTPPHVKRDMLPCRPPLIRNVLQQAMHDTSQTAQSEHSADSEQDTK